jgi:uncharacterized protein with HEPN domain
MSKRDISFYIVDIFIAMDKIKRYSKNYKNAQDLLFSELNWDATLRELEIVGEATKHLLSLEILPISYRRIVDFRNQISHAYFGIDENIIWEIINDKLPLYENELFNIIQTNSIDLTKSITKIREEKFINKHIEKLLQKISKF